MFYPFTQRFHQSIQSKWPSQSPAISSNMSKHLWTLRQTTSILPLPSICVIFYSSCSQAILSPQPLIQFAKYCSHWYGSILSSAFLWWVCSRHIVHTRLLSTPAWKLTVLHQIYHNSPIGCIVAVYGLTLLALFNTTYSSYILGHALPLLCHATYSSNAITNQSLIAPVSQIIIQTFASCAYVCRNTSNQQCHCPCAHQQSMSGGLPR